MAKTPKKKKNMFVIARDKMYMFMIDSWEIVAIVAIALVIVMLLSGCGTIKEMIPHHHRSQTEGFMEKSDAFHKKADAVFDKIDRSRP